MVKASEIIALAEKISESKAKVITDRSQIPKESSYIYIVTNGDDLLQLGKTTPAKGTSSKGRLLSLFKGSPPSIHNKSFIVGLAEVVLNNPNKFYLLAVDDSETIENLIHSKLGIRTNRDACVFIGGHHRSSIKETEKYLFEKFKDSDYFKNQFSEAETRLVDLVFGVVKNGVKFVRESGQPAKYRSGDVLSGSVLLASGYVGLAPIWQKMCRQYFKYSDYYLHLAQSSSELSKNVRFETQLEVHGSDDEFHHEANTFAIPIKIKNQQFLNAKEMLGSHSASFKTKNFYFETNDANYVFVIEKPGGNTGKIDEILEKTKGNDLEFHELEMTGRRDEKQFKTGLGSCYFETRSRAFDRTRKGNFSQT